MRCTLIRNAKSRWKNRFLQRASFSSCIAIEGHASRPFGISQNSIVSDKRRQRSHDNIHILVFQLSDDMQIGFLRCGHAGVAEAARHAGDRYADEQHKLELLQNVKKSMLDKMFV